MVYYFLNWLEVLLRKGGYKILLVVESEIEASLSHTIFKVLVYLLLLLVWEHNVHDVMLEELKDYDEVSSV